DDLDPSIEFTNSTLRPFNFSTRLIPRYLEFAAEALGQFVGDNGQWHVTDEAPAIILPDQEDLEPMGDADLDAENLADETLDDDEIDVDESEAVEPAEQENDEEAEKAEKHPAKPNFKAPRDNGDGTFKEEFESDGSHYAWSGAAGHRIEAMQSAWHAYFES
ncbi:protelomerase, partial [Klebsiella pneumoniae]